ncbi:hypothetical protein CC85DRAFT_305736 [Cutaneotrichosporon oleaginosum]|uniref:Uncharacterized protein n=1 Tax=Cutaneotrichosporon oleaginosum TaxID=879819 RepID=A0A0J0XC84_9TREE|nr:uncharacterized protein CC85DRAFT_305736 [Cutaneotrichosporon oleaginosum]KLT38683.1 hypothetical protein CC85DRAFT_305736 [Cutaneotrichosporon oleaginosum]TXT08265.1 hypothetical protein COLE_05189 [Cutaneotrichosporon oleaginosum]
MRPLRQAVSAESMTYASASAAVPISESSSQPLSTFKASVKERVSELEKKAEAGGTPSAYRLSPSKQDLARAAAVPLPEDSPVVPKPSLPLRAQLPDSPSFAMPLNRHPGWNDTLEMPTLLELSLADMTICPSAETPGHAPRRQHSQPLKEATPPPGSVAQLIGRFSSPSETPSKTPRSSTSPSSGESRPQKTSPLSAEVTGSSSSTPAAQRRISPLPRRVSTVMPATYDSPSLSLKRKGSDIELSFAQSTPIPRSKAAPRFSQPLIAFGDMSQNISPFVFGNGAGVFDDLMAIQTGVGEEDEIVHEGFTQLLEGLVVKDAAGFQGDLLGSPAPAALPPALKPEITGGSDLLDFGDDEVEHAAIKSAAHGVKANADESENDETVMEMRPEMVVDVAPIVTVNEEPKTSEAEGEDADETVHAITIASAEAPTPRTPQPVHASPASQPSKQPSTSKLRSEPPLDICALASSMTAATLQSPAHSAHVAQSFTPNQTPPATSAPEPMSVAPSTLPSSSPKITPVNVNLKEVIPVAPSVLNEERSEAEDSLEKKKLLTELEEQPLQQATEEAPIAPLGATTSATDTTSGVAESIPSDPKVGAETSVPAPVASAQPVQPPVMAPTRSRGHVRSTTAPVKSTHTSGRLGPPSRAARGHGDKKPFKPVSRLGTAEGKAAPAPARLAMATKASQAKPAATAAPAHTTSATAPKAPSAPSSKPHSRGPSRPASRAVSRTVSPPPEPQPKLSQSSTSTATAAGTQPKPANKATSNLLKPTAAASARAAATVAAKEKEVKEPPKPFRAPSALASRAPTRTASSSRPAHSLFAPTAASRARAEPALPPSKRQRVKLKAPMESFKPGRRPNAKAAVLGETAPRLRQVRRKEKVEEVKTFPLPGPQLASSTFKAPVKELAADQTATEGSPSLNALNIPGSRDETESMARSPTSLSPLAHSAALSPASSRHTERSYDSSKSSPRKMRPSPSRPLDPILTPLHHALAKEATPTRPGRDTPATAHARRISGIPASVQRSLSASRAAPEVVEEDEGRGGFDGRDLFGEGEKEGATSVVRHDVSTPQGKASSLLAKLSAERRALATRDGNKD